MNSDCGQLISEETYAIVRKVGGEHSRLCRLRSGQRILIERLSFDPKDAIGRPYGMFEVSGKVLTPVAHTPTTAADSDSDSAVSSEKARANGNGLVLAMAKTDEESPTTNEGCEKPPQQLTAEEIFALKNAGIGTSDLVSKLVSGNAQFQTRTEYSKQKYVRKKSQKHSDRVIIFRPNIRLLGECYFRKDPEKLGHLRLDQLGLVLQLSAVHAGDCKVFVYEQTLGLLGAALLERMAGNGTLVYLHKGDWPQSIPCLDAMHFDAKHMSAFVSLRITTLLKGEPEEDAASKKEGLTDEQQKQSQKRLERAARERRALEVMQPRGDGAAEGQLDALCLATRTFDPVEVLKRVFPSLRLSGTVVIYSPLRQHLLNAWQWLRSSECAVDLQLSQQFFRAHQVLPNRTHPLMQQNVTGGYVLYATKVTPPPQQQPRQTAKELLAKHARIAN